MDSLETARGIARRRYALLCIHYWFCDALPLLLRGANQGEGALPSAAELVSSADDELTWLGSAADELRPALEAHVAALLEGADDDLHGVLCGMISGTKRELAEVPAGLEKAKGALLGLVDVGKGDTDQFLDALSLLSEEVPPETVHGIVSEWKRELQDHLEREHEWAEERERMQEEASDVRPRTRVQSSVSHIFWGSSCHLATLDAVSRYRLMETFNIGEFGETRRQIENLVRQDIIDVGRDAAYEVWLASRSPKLTGRLETPIQLALEAIMESQTSDGWWMSTGAVPESNYGTALASLVLLLLGRQESHMLAGRDGAEWLASRQLPSGAWRASDRPGADGEPPRESLVTTILAATAIHLADADRYGSTLTLATKWILSQQEPTGTWDDSWYPFPFTSVLATEYLESRTRPASAEDEKLVELPDDGSQNAFRKQGDKWVVRYQGETGYFNDTKGMRYLHHLVYHADEQFSAIELLWAVDGEAMPEVSVSMESAASGYDDELFTSGLPDAGNVVDEQALREMRQKLKELLKEESEAAQDNDPARLAPIVAQRQQLEDHLKKVLGLHGRSRKANDHHARVGSRVRQNIRRGLMRIEARHPELYHHLRNAIRTSPLFTYAPDSSVEWSF